MNIVYTYIFICKYFVENVPKLVGTEIIDSQSFTYNYCTMVRLFGKSTYYLINLVTYLFT